MLTAAIILAAGASSRLGSPKQLALLDGEPLLERAVRTAAQAGLAPILVILGSNAANIEGACHLAGTRVVVNEQWLEGMGSSIRAGVQTLPEHTPGVVLMTCDQPAVTEAHLRRLVAAGAQTGEAIASAYAAEGEPERRGVPAYFPHTHFSKLLLLQGDTGARGLLASAKLVQLDRGEVDVDTPEALARARTLFKAVSGG